MAKKKTGPEWHQTAGLYLAGQEHVDEMDLVVIEMEGKWGVDRLRLLVPLELREKFDRQRYLTNQAIWFGDLEAVKRETARMVKAYQTLDRAATEAGKTGIAPDVWEVALPDGSVAAIVKTNTEAFAANREGRKAKVYTLEEIGRLIHGFPAVAKAKEIWLGTEVTAVRTSIRDPLQSVYSTERELDDQVDDLFGTFDIA
jgi:hypothetical protein